MSFILNCWWTPLYKAWFLSFCLLLLATSFVAGMNVGEKRRSRAGVLRLWLLRSQGFNPASTVGAVDFEVWLSTHERRQGVALWFEQLPELRKRVQSRGLYLFSRTSRQVARRPWSFIWLHQIFWSTQRLCRLKIRLRLSKEAMLQLQPRASH